MNLKSYYSKVQETEALLADTDVLIVSESTPDGGRPGVFTLVPRRVASQLIVEGRARAASSMEKDKWEKEESAKREELRREEISQRIQVQVVADSESRKRER